MTTSRKPDDTPGGRIAALRSARRMTQTDLARAASVSLSMIRKLERGVRKPSDNVLDAIAAALNVDPSRLLNGADRRDGRVHDTIPLLRKAIATCDFPDDGPVRPLPQLQAAVDEAVRWRLEAQYVRLSHALPDLLAELIRGLQTMPGLAPLLVAGYRAADAAAFKYGYLDLSARLIDLMRGTSALTDDPLLAASTGYVRTEIFFATSTYHAGLRALELEIDLLPEGGGEDFQRLGVLGSLHMRAAVIAARGGQTEAALSHLGEARRLGGRVAEGIYYGTAFGPDSVRIHEVSVAVSLGDPHLGLALDLAKTWTPPAVMPAERRSGFFIELARAQLWAGMRDAAFESLRAARRIAPQHTREHRWVREDVETLLRLHRAGSEPLIGFADWLGVT
ncbi:helix-turn-helix domain-containing protein [Sphaerimonospora cavernae]|uniref:Helix-turn-helix domain-containing protein n=1 Tax=Sphaerimonospora cavernae TaxID=1740611 RepID=A0ABV6UBU4_9ACTN